MQIWPDTKKESSNGCCSLTAVDDARRVAEKLGIPYYVLNFKEVFNKEVIQYFIEEYRRGRTPNPCVMCNKYVKFAELLDRALAMDFDYIATGHYAKIAKKDGRFLLEKSASIAKDQTYALYNLTQKQLARTIFPLGDYDKDHVREIARDLALTVANKPDSQEICFVEDNDYAKFIQEHSDSAVKPGDFVDSTGKILGQHKGIYHYTIGQRKGLGIAVGRPLYVIDVDVVKNQVVLGDESELLANHLIARHLNWIAFASLEKPLQAAAKIRYGSREVPVEVRPLADGRVDVHFLQPQRAITPGQSIVFYDGNTVLGGGVIDEC
jgi:tRNA-specific 2-thiouridylase